MKKRICALTLACILLSGGILAYAEGTISNSCVPLSVSNVRTGLVGDSLVRSIQHNMEINPILQFEIISRPIVDVLDAITIKDISCGGKTLSFRNSSGAYVEEISFQENSVEFVVDYFHLEGGSIALLCTLPVSNDRFSQLSCIETTLR